MKRILTLVLGFVLPAGCFAVLWVNFRGWDTLTSESPDIAIGRCITAEPGVFYWTNGTTVMKGYANNGTLTTDFEILQVLKGESRTGKAKVVTSGPDPQFGRMYLLFSHSSNGQGKEGQSYSATEDYRVVPISDAFDFRVLEGKSLAEQIHLILRARLQEVEKQTQALERERRRLESAFPK